MKFLLLLMLTSYVLGIVQQCSTSQQCPTNAQCQLNGMCACNPGFIGSCSTSAYFITSASTSVALNSNTTTYFYVNPEQLDTFIEITFQICLNQPTQLNTVLTLWGQTGYIATYTLGNALGNPTSATLTPGCQQFITPYITFDTQPNGQNQMLVLGITDGSIPASITISATQQQISGTFIYYYVIVAIVVVAVIVIVVGVAVWIVRKRRRRLGQSLGQGLSPAATGPALNNIEHFQSMMPSFIAQKLGPQKMVCAICLQNIELSEMVRQTFCKHTFHCSCIDSWCLKNLSCPVCRTDLGLDNMMERSRRSSCCDEPTDRAQLCEQPSMPPQPVQMGQDLIHNNEVENTVEMVVTRDLNFDENKYQIRQHML